MPMGNISIDSIRAPLATYEPSLVASCSRGCKAFNIAGGVNYEVLADGMSRAPALIFDHPGDAACFAQAIRALEAESAGWAESTGQHVQLKKLLPSVIGSQVHLLCTYHCGSAAGQNMVTRATKHACDMLREKYENRFVVRDFSIEGQLASDKKASWGNVKTRRGVEVIVWGTITNQACQSGFGCRTDRLLLIQNTDKEGGIRNGQFSSKINNANIRRGLLSSRADRVWHPGTKGRLAGVIAAAAWALDASTSATVADDAFTQSHMRLARGENDSRLWISRL